jgi:hypothetical protein
MAGLQPREQKRREDARAALPKLSQNEKNLSLISHEVLLECDASSHRFWETKACTETGNL